MTVLRTDRLTLRRARMSDLDAVHALLSDPRAMRYWSTPEHETLQETQRWLTAMVAAGEATEAALAAGTPAEGDDFLVEHEGRVIGKAGAWILPEVGYLLAPDLWGRGLAHEAMQAAITHIFAHHAVPALTADVDPRNAASVRLLARLGFAETHRAERTLLWRDEWCDSVYFALHRPAGPTA